MRLLVGPAPEEERRNRALLVLRAEGMNTRGYARVEELSGNGDSTEAAARLFTVLRRLDALGLDGIDAVPLPESDLGRAINDRLRRASVR